MNRTCQITSDRCAHKMTVYSSDIADDVSVCYDDTLWISSSTTGVVYCHHIVWGMKLNEWGERENEWMDEWVSNWMSGKWVSERVVCCEIERKGEREGRDWKRERGREEGTEEEREKIMTWCVHVHTPATLEDSPCQIPGADNSGTEWRKRKIGICMKEDLYLNLCHGVYL